MIVDLQKYKNSWKHNSMADVNAFDKVAVDAYKRPTWDANC